MKWRTFHSCEKLAAGCAKISDEFDAVSLDIFDTVLIRRVHNPDLLKLPVARFIAARAASAGGRWTAKKILRLRNGAESIRRRRNGQTYPDAEASYPDFMTDALARIFPEYSSAAIQDLLREVTDYELALESRMLVPRAAIRDFMARMHQQGKRIILVSDMYLPATHIKRLIAAAGLEAFVDGVVSSADTCHTKASGAAWPLIRERFQLDPARWLHIGDNPISDGLRPMEYGLRAAVLRDPAEMARKAVIGRYWEIARRRPFWRGRLVQQLTLPLEAENALCDPLYVAGHNFFAPFFCAFIQHIAEQCQARKLKRIYFFAREGELLLQIWNKMAPTLFSAGQAPSAHYLYVSRAALAGPSCAERGLDPENAAIAFLPATSRDIRDLCRVFALDLEPLVPHLRRHGLRTEDALSRHHAGWNLATDGKFKRLLDDPDFQDEIKRQTRDAAEALQRYLAGEHFFDQPDVAVVDIGWLGTIQRFLFQAVAHRHDRPRLHGFVFALAGHFPFPASADNRIEGYVFDRTAFDFAGSLIMTARDLFEEVARAAHPGLLGYRLKGDGFTLEFRQQDDAYARNESAQSAYYAPLRAGILDAAGRYASAMHLLDYAARDMKPWLNSLLVSRLAFPHAHEVKLLRHIHHMDDFAGNHAPLKRFRKNQAGLWNTSPQRLRLMPWIKLWEYGKHAVCMLRQ